MLNLKRAVVSAVVFYAMMFLLASVYMFVLGLAGDIFGAAMIVTDVVLIALLAKYYYFKPMNKNYVKPMDGLLFGIAVAVISVIIEIPVMVYGFAKDMGWMYFASWHIMLGYLLVALIPAAIAYMKK